MLQPASSFLSSSAAAVPAAPFPIMINLRSVQTACVCVVSSSEHSSRGSISPAAVHFAKYSPKRCAFFRSASSGRNLTAKPSPVVIIPSCFIRQSAFVTPFSAYEYEPKAVAVLSLNPDTDASARNLMMISAASSSTVGVPMAIPSACSASLTASVSSAAVRSVSCVLMPGTCDAPAAMASASLPVHPNSDTYGITISFRAASSPPAVCETGISLLYRFIPVAKSSISPLSGSIAVISSFSSSLIVFDT